MRHQPQHVAALVADAGDVVHGAVAGLRIAEHDLTVLLELADELGPPELVRELEENRQIVLRYAEPCNGSVDDIAGVCNERGNVLGLMPHPEHAVDPLLGSPDGALILASLVEAARERVLAAI